MRVEAAEGFDDPLEAGLADGGVFSADLHGAGDAEGVTHGGDGDAAFFEEGAKEWIGDWFGQGDRVTFPALHGEGESDLLGEVGGVDTTCKDDGIGLVGLTRFGGDAFDYVSVCGEFANVSGDEFSTVGEDGFTKGRDEFPG